MAKTKDSINSSIFYALKNSETSGVPILLIGSAGTGKSTTVEMFAQLRGYELLLLRGSTASEQEIMGFMSVHQGKDNVVATNVLPTWYTKMLEYHAQGKKTLLFLDEITAVNPYVQAALLHLIFERKVNENKIPDDCLIVSAGNYSGNLTNEFELLSPVVNRFCVFNITPDSNSLDEFLSVYDGANVGKKKDILKEKELTLKQMDSQRVALTDEMRCRVGQYFETAIRETTRSLMTSGDKPLSFACTDTQSIYKAQEGDELVRGFVSLRTLSYLTRLTISVYENFGAPGIQGSNFKRILEGLVGIALSRKNGEAVATKVADHYYQSITQCLSSISKLSNTKIKVYEDFFNKLVDKSKSELTQEEITVILDKLEEMKNDPEIKSVTKPLEDEVITKLCELTVFNAKKVINVKFKPNDDIKTVLTTEATTGMIVKWNKLADLFHYISNVSSATGNTYSPAITKVVKDSQDKLIEVYMKLGSYSKMAISSFPEFKSLIPAIKSIK